MAHFFKARKRHQSLNELTEKNIEMPEIVKKNIKKVGFRGHSTKYLTNSEKIYENS